MSLRPGARWSPQTQGIAGGIGSAFAGVSDQIRRVMQDRPTLPISQPGGNVGAANSGPLAFTGTVSPSWTIPAGAVSGWSLMVIYAVVEGAAGVPGFTFVGNSVAGLTPSGRGYAERTLGAGTAPLDIILHDPPSGTVTVTFGVLAW